MDLYFFQQINQFAGRWSYLDNLGVFFAEYSGYVLAIFLLSFLFYKDKKNKLMVVEALLSAVLARLVITNIIRYICFRPRPFTAYQVNLLLDHSVESSFPSGHASFFFALAFAVLFFNKKVGILFLIVSFLMGVGRVFAGIHYPSDILVGFFVGVFSAWVVDRYLRKHTQNLIP